MEGDPERPVMPNLALLSQLDWWEVSLKDGTVLRIRCHGYVEEDGYHVFDAILEGDPPELYPITQIPSDAITRAVTLPPTRHTGGAAT
jgi:hypothetical protein